MSVEARGARRTEVLGVAGQGRVEVRARVTQLSGSERARQGRRMRRDVPRSSHATWDPSTRTSQPVDLLVKQSQTRIPELVPIRHGRMLVSPFAYFRGAALPMASDLAATPATECKVQLCGDAHLANFGVFGSPERRLVFDLNDFDETAPGPWEWDVKRLAASLEVAGRDHGFSRKERRGIVRRAVRSYRDTMRQLAGMPMLEVWYAHLDMDALLPRFQSLLDPKRTPSVWRAVAKARAHDSLRAFEKLCPAASGEPRIASDPPLIVPIEELIVGVDPEVALDRVRALVGQYVDSLPSDRRRLFERYRLAHVARKVVGVGSVGTDAWIALFLDRDHASPLFLQVKEAEASVLESFTSRSGFSNHGERVVAGQRLMQEASDILLGWARFRSAGAERDYYVRQLRDWKGSADVQGMTRAGMELWGRMCGWTLARAHARSGDRIAIASYLGTSDAFDRAVAEFSVAYADQTERDYESLQAAIRSGGLTAETGV